MTTNRPNANRVPKTAIDFEKLIAKHKAEWPDDLHVLAMFALNSMKVMERPDNQAPHIQELHRRDLKAFASAYAEWQAAQSA